MSDEDTQRQIDYLRGRLKAMEIHTGLLLGLSIEGKPADNRTTDVDDQQLAALSEQLRIGGATAEELRGFHEAWMDVRDTVRSVLRSRRGRDETPHT